MMWYLDADIITFEPVPMSWLEHIIPDHAFTSYLGRPKKGFSETGYYAFNTAHEFAEEFFKRWQQYYDDDLFFKKYTAISVITKIISDILKSSLDLDS